MKIFATMLVARVAPSTANPFFSPARCHEKVMLVAEQAMMELSSKDFIFTRLLEGRYDFENKPTLWATLELS